MSGDNTGSGPLLTEVLADAARRHPSKVALVADRRRVTYAELDAHSTALANALVRRKVGKGDRVICFLDHSIEAVIGFWGVLKANAVAVMVHPYTKSDRLGFILTDCRPVSLVIGADLVSVSEATRRCRSLHSVIVTGRFRGEWAWDGAASDIGSWGKALAYESTRVPPPSERSDTDAAALVYTALGRPTARAVMLSHHGMIESARSLGAAQRVREDDVVLACLPLSSDYALYQMIAAAQVGARVIVERTIAWPEEMLTGAIIEGVTVLPAMPTVLSAMLEAGVRQGMRVPSMRCIASTGDPTPKKYAGSMREVFPNAEMHSTYGMTECRNCAHMTPEHFEEAPTSVGKACPGTDLWIADPDGARLPPGSVGELVAATPATMMGYWERPDETERAFRPALLPDERAFFTGDQCRMDADGFVYLVGRSEEIIESSGTSIALKEIERVLHAIPGVKEAAVIGMRDKTLGRVPKAFVALERGAVLAVTELGRISRDRLVNGLVLRHLEVWRALPKDHHGKIDRPLLARVAAPDEEAPLPPPRDPSDYLSLLESDA